MFAIEHFGVQPDIITWRRGLRAGYQAVGACIVRDHVGDAFVGEEDGRSGTGTRTAGIRRERRRRWRTSRLSSGKAGGEFGGDGTSTAGPSDGVEGVAHRWGRAGVGVDVAPIELGEGQGDEGVAFVGAGGRGQAVGAAGGERLLTRTVPYLNLTPALTLSAAEVDEIADIVKDGIEYIEKELGY